MNFLRLPKKMLITLALLLYVLSLAAALVPISSLRIDNSLEIWFYENDPDRSAYDKAHQLFGNWDWLSIYVRPQNSIYDTGFLSTVSELSNKLKALHDVRKVISISNARGNLLNESELSYQEILGTPPWTPEQLGQFQKTLDTNLVYRKALIQPESNKDTTILLQIHNRDTDKDAYRIELINNIDNILSTYRGSIKYYALAGTPYLNAELNRSSRHDMYVFIPLVTLLVMVIAWLIFHNIRDVIITMVTLSGVTLWSIGLMMLKYELNMVTIMMPTILVTVSVANVMHVIVSFHLLRREHCDWSTEKAVKTVMKDLWIPSLGTTTSTAFGFLSLVQADIFPITLLGYFSALGIMFAYVLTFTLLPLLLMVFWGNSKTDIDISQVKENRSFFYRIPWFSIISKTSLVYPFFVIGLFAVIGGGICVGIYKLDADTDYVDMFTEKTHVKAHYRDIKQAGYATNSLTMLIHAPNGLEDATTFRSAMVLEQAIAKLPLTKTVFEPVKILAEVDRALAIDKGTWQANFQGYGREAFAQLMLTAEISGNDDLRDVLTPDYKNFQMMIFTYNLSSHEIRTYANDLSQLAHSILPPGSQISITGTPLLWANMDHHLLVSQSNILRLFPEINLPIRWVESRCPIWVGLGYVPVWLQSSASLLWTVKSLSGKPFC